MNLPITIEPNEILHRVTRKLNSAELSTTETKKLIKDMIETMYIEDGVGIAANQVGVSLQICVIAKQYTHTPKEDLVLINPTWEKISIRRVSDNEGCLSVPHTYGEVKRYKKIRVRALDKNGKPIEFIAEDFFARIVQHETDHLNGQLFIEKAKNIQVVEPNM